ncbi:MAG TPA: hypothetical protein VLS90_09765, partial [Thermodesulfobacteriota bacterium]|nr:hypothetical protein [Thermodesulfobacteriota bacterium]
HLLTAPFFVVAIEADEIVPGGSNLQQHLFFTLRTNGLVGSCRSFLFGHPSVEASPHSGHFPSRSVVFSPGRRSRETWAGKKKKPQKH